MHHTKGLAYCHYINGEAEDFGTEALRLYLPTHDGYINYNLVHSVSAERNCDVWRLGPAYHCNDAFQNKILLTRPRAEWEMAIRLKDRPDFIGGVVHGDEIMQDVQFTINGKRIALETLLEPTAFETLTMEVHSVGFDPNDSTTRVLLHTKLLTVDCHGVRADQTVEWLTDEALGSSYLAMMPPLKDFTSCYCTDEDPTPHPIPAQAMQKTAPVKTLCLRGDAGFSFSMTVEKHLTDGVNNIFSITDNGGSSYNKMYFVLAHGGTAHRGDIWKTTTLYRIEKY